MKKECLENGKIEKHFIQLNSLRVTRIELLVITTGCQSVNWKI